MRMQELMTRDTASCTPDASLQEAAQLMNDRDCGILPVVEQDSHRLLGLITDRDITCRAVAKGMDPSSTPIKQVMSNPVIAVTPDASVEDALEKMERAQVRRIPVVDGQGTCLGMVSQADIATHCSADDTHELLAAVSQPNQHSSRMQGGM